jgi:four helix bundle protein
MRNAAASVGNIAEGFGRFVPRDFSQYLRIANGSLMETSNHLQDGLDRGYFRAADVEPLQILARRASAAVAALIRYLLTAPNPNSAIRPSRDPQNRRREPENRRTRAPKNQNPDT